MSTGRKVYQMPDAQRVRWMKDGKRKNFDAAPDHERRMVIAYCGARIELPRDKALKLADMLVDLAEQLPD
ncbi:hypothetical protein ACG98H_07850 [Corynebacterium sp. L4756]|uniref:hypothetical protein n=1 Tax=unclassified Corynebacterium TaxID=2624378 RepID=UPI00374D059E